MPTGIYKRSEKEKERCRKMMILFASNPEYKKKALKTRAKNPIRYWSGKKRPTMTGENNWNWKGGIRKSNGYVWILKPFHLRACDNYVKRAILVMERKIRRPLTKDEAVHHINENKDDDRIENLWLFSTGNEHKRYHLRVMQTYKKWTGLEGRAGNIFKEIKRVYGNNFGYDNFPN